MKKFLIFSLLLFLLALPFKVAAANPSDIVINEIAWMGTTNSANDEWIELYNNTENPINLDSWRLIAQDGTPKINLSGTIPANVFYLLERTDDTTVPNVPADQIYTGALGNTGETLELYDNFGNLIDRVDNSSGWSAGDNTTKQTMERKTDGNWQTSQGPGGTPKAKNSEENQELRIMNQETKEYPSGIVVSEILPYPEGPDAEEEWIEIFNQNNSEVDLSDWKITDTAGKTNIYAFPFEIKISAQGFLVFSRPTTKITLNNDGDGLLLIQPNENILDSVNYQKAPRGQSYNRTESDWAWSSSLTPGSANIILSSATETTSTKPNKEKTEESPKQLAALGEQLPKSSKSLHVFLVAFGLAIFSVVIILVLKNKVKIG